MQRGWGFRFATVSLTGAWTTPIGSERFWLTAQGSLTATGALSDEVPGVAFGV